MGSNSLNDRFVLSWASFSPLESTDRELEVVGSGGSTPLQRRIHLRDPTLMGEWNLLRENLGAIPFSSVFHPEQSAYTLLTSKANA